MSDFFVGQTEPGSFEQDRPSLDEQERRTDVGNPRSMLGDAWYDLRHTWTFPTPSPTRQPRPASPVDATS